MVQTLLVTGIHREELGFGDRVAELLDKRSIQIMRIPQGISHTRSGTDGLFYYNTRHREIYLQLWQQVKGQYRLLLDLHSGLNDSGRCAELYCRHQQMLRCVKDRSKQIGIGDKLRLVKILKDAEKNIPYSSDGETMIAARTLIPEQLWNDQTIIYVGLEIYLKEEGKGSTEDWLFALELIELVQACAESLQHNYE